MDEHPAPCCSSLLSHTFQAWQLLTPKSVLRPMWQPQTRPQQVMPVLQVPQSPFHGSQDTEQNPHLSPRSSSSPSHTVVMPATQEWHTLNRYYTKAVPITARLPDVQLNKDLQHSGICVNSQASEEPGNSMGRWRKSLLSSSPKAGNWPTQTMTLNSNLSLINYSTSSILAPNKFHGKKSFQVLLKELDVQ